MTFEALVPLTLNTKTKGILELKAGDRMDVPERVIRQLQAQVPDKIRVIPEPPAKDPLLGQRVRYVIPVEKKWQTFTGKCTMVRPCQPLGVSRTRPGSVRLAMGCTHLYQTARTKGA